MTSPLITEQLAKRLTRRAKIALEDSARVAKRGASTPITASDLLRAIASQRGSLGASALTAHGISVPKKRLTGATVLRAEASADVKVAMKKAAHIALKHSQHFIGTEHLLYGILDKADQLPSLTMAQRAKIKRYLEELLESSSSFSHLYQGSWGRKRGRGVRGSAGAHEHLGDQLGRVRLKITEPSTTPTLERFCDNLTDKAAKGLLDPLVGRGAELDRIIRVLTRRTKNNPLLVGEPGVGKTALVAGLASRIHEGTVPPSLTRKRLFSLNLNALVAGTTFRGEFEERMRDLANEASRNDVLLFIDEIHTLVGAGAAQGSLDAANILKPALVTGAFQCIGATTFDEYKKSIEKDGALERRFQKVVVAEESPEASKETLARLAPLYEKHHNVNIEPVIISLCVDMAVRYLPHRTLPDKALDIMDEAASKTTAEAAGVGSAQQIGGLQQQIAQLAREKAVATRNEHYTKASRLQQEQDELERDLRREMSTAKTEAPRVTEETVREVVAEMAGIPLSSLRASTFALSLSESLGKKVIGQDKAVAKIVSALERSSTMVRDENRPIGSFLFVGPSGVGKTHLAKTLANSLLGKASFVKLDMSEFSEGHTIARLIGAPAGYVGYEESGFLTDHVRRNPSSVILFDEIEKAHPRVLNILLQILEDGTLTDAQGRPASFKHTIIILTSNIGTSHEKRGNLGFAESGATSEARLRELLSERLRPEVVNRIDEIVAFEELGKENLSRIAHVQLEELALRLAPRASFTATASVSSWLATHATAKEQGARAIRALITEHIENPLAARLVREDTATIKARADKNGITLSYS
ncbi:MAG: ATP-dependent Clp protease ATP-binding subunit [Candidatus Spechtbacterales bacterium]